MSTPALAKKKWEAKMVGAGAKWKKAVSPEKFEAGLREFFGSANPDAVKAYGVGTGAVSASDFEGAVKGKGDKWLTKLKEALA